MSTPAEINNKVRHFFESKGFMAEPPKNVINAEGKTDLIIAGVQVFDGVIHRNLPLRDDRMYIAQPSIRMQFQSQVGNSEGTSTSFVNICTERMGIEFEDHLSIVDSWCDILPQLGLHADDITIVMRTSENDWGTGAFTSLELFFLYGGLELGDAAYMTIPQSSRQAIHISDIGFGLERIVWAINKTQSYFDPLAPITVPGPKEMHDSCRTIALLALCGVQASKKGPGLQLRRFAKVLVEKYIHQQLYQCLGFYFDYWSEFIPPAINKLEALEAIRLEIDRFTNLAICERLKLPPPREETTEAYFNRLVYTCGIDIHRLSQAIQA